MTYDIVALCCVFAFLALRFRAHRIALELGRPGVRNVGFTGSSRGSASSENRGKRCSEAQLWK